MPKCLPGEIVEAQIVKETKKYYEGKLIKVINPSIKRINSVCPYFDKCGGCNLLNLNYDDTLEYKKNKVKEIFKKYLDYDISIDLIKSDKYFNYRNKVIFHIENSVIGLVDEENRIISINKCLMINETINKAISFIKNLKINNGNVLVRCNYLNELLISINTDDNIKINKINNNIVGIVLNDKIVYGNDYFIESINDIKFKVSYKSFFQINPYITNKLFDLVKENTKNSINTLDLYCGVGTLGIVASFNSKKVIGIDYLKNNIEDAKFNMEFNNINNIEFVEGDASTFDKYMNIVDTIIVDPPRNGLNKETLKKIIKNKPKKIIYISCDPFTLVRDLNELTDVYKIEKYYLLDMFPYTHHIESMLVLSNQN